MFEKVNPCHPDKIADRIAGAMVDLAYTRQKNPKIAVEVLIGHNHATIISESSVHITKKEVKEIVKRIANVDEVKYIQVPQDSSLAYNQIGHIRCGDNGIFKGVPKTDEETELSSIACYIYTKYHSDGKYILNGKKLIICQSNAKNDELRREFPNAIINPLGEWTGGLNVDSGATNRKIGSDMGNSITGGGLHGKDLSKGDVSINIYAWLKAQKTKKTVEINVAIGDEYVDGKPFGEIVCIAKEYIKQQGGFEKFAEWGLI